MASKITVIRKYIVRVTDPKTKEVIFKAEYRDEIVKTPCMVKPDGCNSIWFINSDRAITININGATNLLDADGDMFVNTDPRTVITSDFNLK